MKRIFLDDQKKAFRKLKKVKCGALFMEPGTGKTQVAYELIKSTRVDYVLWIVPFQTKNNILNEINKCGGMDCEIVGIESIQNSDRIFLSIQKRLLSCKASFIIIDESLKIKNNEAKRTKRLFELSKISTYRLILNGTPLSKNLLDIWSQFHFLSPQILNMNLAQFKNTFCEYISITKHSNGFGRSITKEFIKRYHNMDYLYKIIEPFIFESKLSLNVGKQYINIDFDLSTDELNKHNELKSKYLNNEYLMFKNNNIFLEITQKIQHNYSLSSEKFIILDKLLENINKDKVLIYAKYIDSQEKLKEYYQDIQIMSLQKHSYGLNLQDYNVIVFWDKTWDYAQKEQIERRIFRTGQSFECIFYDFTGNVGLEKMINENISKKRNLLDMLIKTNNKAIIEKL